MQVLFNNIQSIIDTIENTKNNNELKGEIKIENCNSMWGVIRECQTMNDWYDFENELLQLMKDYPNYSEIGHTHGLSCIYPKEYLDSKHPKYMNRILLPIDKSFIQAPNVQEYHLGQCIVTYHKGSYETMEDTFSNIVEYIHKENIEIRGDVIETEILGSFIVNNEDEYLIEIKVPIM